MYAFNLWDDANSYFTMGRSMLRGYVPYRDLFDQKGIYLYSIYALASLFSSTSFIGVYVMEIIAAFLSLLALFMILRMYLGGGFMSYVFTSLLGTVIYTSVCFYWGGSAEEFLFPWICWGLYLSVSYFYKYYPEPMSYGRVLLGGILAGLVFNIKFNSLGFFFAWMMMVFVADLLGGRAIAKAFISCFVFLFGMVFITIPAIIYFALNNALDDWLYVYLYKNIFEYSKSLSIAERIAAVWDIMTDHVYSNPICYLLIFVGAVYFTVAFISYLFTERKGGFINRSDFFVKEKVIEYINIVCLLGFLILVIFAGGVTLMYYPFPINAFCVFGAVAVGKLIKGLNKLLHWYMGRKASDYGIFLTKGQSVFALIVVQVLCTVIIFTTSMNVEAMSLKKKDLWLYKFRDYIASSGVDKPKLINMHGFDMGLYTVTDSDPVCYYYQTQTLNLEEVLDYQYSYITDGKVDFVVSACEIGDDIMENYTLVMQDTLDINGMHKEYYLYERNDLLGE